MPSATRSIDVDVPADAFMEVITDFERYPDFVSSVIDARIEEADEGRWRVRFDVQLLRRRMRYRLDLSLVDAARIEWQLVDGDRMLRNEGYWQLTALDPQATRALYSVYVDVEGPLPHALLSLLMDASLPRMLREFKRRAESLVASTLEFH
jgi:coenzyme Q-binding protein COQ10